MKCKVGKKESEKKRNGSKLFLNVFITALEEKPIAAKIGVRIVLECLRIENRVIDKRFVP